MTSEAPVLDRDGRRGVLEAPPGGGRAALRLDSGARVEVPAGRLAAQPDGSYRLDVAFGDLELETWAQDAEAITLPVAEERLRVGKREVETGRVRLTRRVEQIEEAAEATLARETVEVERVPIGRFVDAVAPPREEDGVTIIPVYEEVLVVEKRLRLKEELRIVRHRTEERVRQPVTLRRATIDVERVGVDGTVTPIETAAGAPAAPPEPDARPEAGRAPRFDYLNPQKNPFPNPSLNPQSNG